MRSWHTLTKLPNCFSDQNMKRYVTTILSLGLLAGSAHASSGIYLCTDKKGNKEYRNTNITKDCKKVDLPYLTTIPAPVAPKPEPQRSEESKKFPQVDKSKQEALDKERKKILEDELRAEKKKLSTQKKEYNNGEPERLGSERNYQRYLDRVKQMKENIERTEKNIDALQREVQKMN